MLRRRESLSGKVRDSVKETILLYGFKDGERLLKVKKALLLLGMRMKTVAPSEYSQPVGYLAGIKEIPPSSIPYEGPEFEKEMLVMGGLTSARIDAVIQILRKTGVGRIDYKAVVTPTNQVWDALRLYEEIAREHEAMQGINGPSAS